MRKPKPTVTAETPSGSISSASKPRTSRPARLVSAAAASPPISTAMAVAATAYRSEFPIASRGGTRKVPDSSSEPSAR